MLKKIYNTLYIMLVGVLFASCAKDPKSEVQNGNFQVEFLFEENGCKMYRFLDGKRYIYWSDCKGKVQSEYTERTGKSTVHIESITSE